jgi:hypothetical protein
VVFIRKMADGLTLIAQDNNWKTVNVSTKTHQNDECATVC